MNIGTDIIQISRIETALSRHGKRFTARFLTPDEITILPQRPQSLAGYWAAKEAVAKALGCGIGHELGFHDIRVTKNDKGAPSFVLSDTTQKRFTIANSSLSISHDGGFAIAVVAIVLSDD